MVRAATEAMSGLECESVITPAIIPRALNQRKPIRLPSIGARHPAHGRAQPPAALAAYWKSPCVK
jgi:hypothetical protein